MIAERDECPEWLIRISAKVLLGQLSDAQSDLGTVFSRFPLSPCALELASRVIDLRTQAGWCALTSSGRLRVWSCKAISFALGDVILKSLPKSSQIRRAQSITVKAGDEPLLGSPLEVTHILKRGNSFDKSLDRYFRPATTQQQGRGQAASERRTRGRHLRSTPVQSLPELPSSGENAPPGHFCKLSPSVWQTSPIVVLLLTRDSCSQLPASSLVRHYRGNLFIALASSFSSVTERRLRAAMSALVPRRSSLAPPCTCRIIRPQQDGVRGLLAEVIAAAHARDIFFIPDIETFSDLDRQISDFQVPSSSTIGTVGPDCGGWLYLRRACAESILTSLDRRPLRGNGTMLSQVRGLARLRGWVHSTAASSRPRVPIFGAEQDITSLSGRELTEGKARPVLIVTHNQGGGVARAVELWSSALADLGRETLTLAPVCEGRVRINAGASETLYRLPAQIAQIARDLSKKNLHCLIFHHLLGHAP